MPTAIITPAYTYASYEPRAQIDSTLIKFRFRQMTTVNIKLMQGPADIPITTHQLLTESEPDRVLGQRGGL
jgi:hypothetical protein